jgi:SAM-dependent methyltransferase
MTSIQQHQVEIENNLAAWRRKPLLQEIYQGFYREILGCIDTRIPGLVVELGSGIGNLKQHLPQALATDLFPNPWLDLACDAYELPFEDGSVSHLVLFDVFHHLQAPRAFLNEARRVLGKDGRIILFEPFISTASYPVYGLVHHEPVALRATIELAERPPENRGYYAAQGNATRLFFRGGPTGWLNGFVMARAKAFSSFAYLLSGGYSKPALYPNSLLGLMRRLDNTLSCFPKLFGARCIIELRKTD